MRNAGRIAATLRQRYGKDRVKVVHQRYDKQAEIGQEDVERVVGSPVKHVVPSDYRAGAAGAEQGRPLALDNGQQAGDAFHDACVRPGWRAGREPVARRRRAAACSAGSRDGVMRSLSLMNTTVITRLLPARPSIRAHSSGGGGDTRSAALPGAEGARFTRSC